MKRLMLLTLVLTLVGLAGSVLACESGQFRVLIDDICGADALVDAGYCPVDPFDASKIDIEVQWFMAPGATNEVIDFSTVKSLY